MHMVWKSRGRVNEVFVKFFWEGTYIGVMKILGGGGYTFLGFIAFWREGPLLSSLTLFTPYARGISRKL